jgi:hypothetical protein
MSKRLLALALASAAAMLAGCDDDDTDLTISNRSDVVIEEVHLAGVNDPTWGPNLLPSVLFPGQDLVIIDIACDTYDVLVVDEFGFGCELLNNRLCFDSHTWVIDNTTLNICAFSPRSQPQGDPAQVSEPAATADPST